MEDHYFGSIKPRVIAYMQDLDEELWKLGIYSKTRHNEVAPAQHEMAPIFTTTNLATDHNQLTMEVMKRVAHKHGLVCLLHEKPFAGVNGSGKHNNWSLSTNTGRNLLKPGKDPIRNTEFLIFLAAIMKGVYEYQDLLRVSVASAGNDHRLGANEAPPAIISMFIGDDLEAVVNAIIEGKSVVNNEAGNMDLGVGVLPDFKKDTTDRNRTSPFAFTGNKFEFRSLGSSLNIACPNIMLNTIVAEELSQFADKLEPVEDKQSAVKALIRETFKEYKDIVFNGDNYSDEWVAEAERRGLLNLRSMPVAMPYFVAEKNVKLFTKHNVHTRREMFSRYEIQQEEYGKVINIEALTMIEMARRDIFPAVSAYVQKLVEACNAKKALSASIPCDAELAVIEKLSKLLCCFYNKIEVLEEKVNAAKGIKDVAERALFYGEEVFNAMNELRAVGDEMEVSTAADYWPYPSYGELLYGVR